MNRATFSLVLVCSVASCYFSRAADWPQWGRDSTRNAVSPEKNPPIDFLFPKEEMNKVAQAGKRIAWTAELGRKTVVPPVIADGLVWVCTNARDPGDDSSRAEKWEGGVLLCLRESDGKQLWKIRSPWLGFRDAEMVQDYSSSALGSSPLVDGDRLWYTNNRSEVVCFDIAPLKKGTGDPRELWKVDLRKDYGVFPHLPYFMGGFGASVAGYKDKLYVVTHNGINQTHNKIPAPDAPSLVCLEKATGKLVWKDNSPGKDILEHQVSSPLVVEIDGKPQAIIGQGDGWLRSFDAATGKLLWKCDLNSKAAFWDRAKNEGERNYIVATPVLNDGKIYIGTGREIEQYCGAACLYCIDPTKRGDVSLELHDGPKKGKPNSNSVVVWHTPTKVPEDAPKIEVKWNDKRDLFRGRGYLFSLTTASVTVHDGLLYAADMMGVVYCFDAKTGKLYWADDLKSSVFSQPLWVDGKVFIVSESDIAIYEHGKTKKLVAKIEQVASMRTGLVFSNGTLYASTNHELFAFRKAK